MRRCIWCVTTLLLAYALVQPALALCNETVGEVPELLQGVDDSCIFSTALGSAEADALLAAAGTDLAIVNGGDIHGNLQGGMVTWNDLYQVFLQDRTVGKAEVTAAQLKELLEIAVSKLTSHGSDDYLDRESSPFDGFAQPGGFSYRCDVSAPVGERILEIRLLSSGEVLNWEDVSTTYTLAASEYMLSGGYGMPALPYQPVGLTLTDAMAFALRESRIQSSYPSRVQIIGVADNSIISHFSPFLMLVVVVLIGLFRIQKRPNDPYREKKSLI